MADSDTMLDNDCKAYAPPRWPRL